MQKSFSNFPTEPPFTNRSQLFEFGLPQPNFFSIVIIRVACWETAHAIHLARDPIRYLKGPDSGEVPAGTKFQVFPGDERASLRDGG